jgi:hypothetical protein
MRSSVDAGVTLQRRPFGCFREGNALTGQGLLVSGQKAWWAALTRAGLKIRFHDLRHTCITKLAESVTSDQTIMAIAGHVSRKMLEHYSHIRMEAKRIALDAIAAEQAPLRQGNESVEDRLPRVGYTESAKVCESIEWKSEAV